MLTDYHDTFGDPDDNVVAAAESTDTPPAQS
jgi:hypothetical protein